MPKYIPNKTAEIEEVQNLEIKRLTKALEEIRETILSDKHDISKLLIISMVVEALNPKQKGK